MISNRDLFAKEYAAIDLKGILNSAQFRDQTLYPAVQDLFVLIELLCMPLVRLPSHALGFRRERPVLGIELANRAQPRINP
jgi:hypothetical protein